MVMTTYMAEISRTVAFSVLETQLPADAQISASNAEQIFNEACRATIKSGRGKLVYRRNVMVKDVPGQEWQVEGFRGAVITVRTVLGPKQSFQAIAVMPRSRYCELHVRRFLDSFQLAQPPTPRPENMAIHLQPTGVESSR